MANGLQQLLAPYVLSFALNSVSTFNDHQLARWMFGNSPASHFSNDFDGALVDLAISGRFKRNRDWKFPLNMLICLPFKQDMENALNNHYRLTALPVKPVIDEAHRDVIRNKILPLNALQIKWVDTNLSDTLGPWVTIEALLHDQLDCIVGYASNYALSPVARSSWLYKERRGVPVITTIGLTDTFDDKAIYKLLTRMNGSYRSMARFVVSVIVKLNWNRYVYLFQSNIVYSKIYGRHECYHQLMAVRNYEVEVKRRFEESLAREVDPLVPNFNLTHILVEVSMMANSKSGAEFSSDSFSRYSPFFPFKSNNRS